MKPYIRERKNSITEISDNEDELLEYHRWQREERLREQEMEKLVSDRHSNDFTPDERLECVFQHDRFGPNQDADGNLTEEVVKKTFAALVCLL